MSTVTDLLLEPLVRSDPVGPRITYYDDASGERIELSAVTLANWAAKTGNLLRDEMSAGPDIRVAVLLPAHWQSAAVLFGIWWIGAEALVNPSGTDTGPADIALCTADRLEEADGIVDGGEVAVLSLDPFGAPAPGLPVGVTDYATSVRVHGDTLAGERRPGPALASLSPSEVVAQARTVAEAKQFGATDRVMSTAPWLDADDVIAYLLAVFAAGASLVQVANPDAAAMQRRHTTEKVTRLLS